MPKRIDLTGQKFGYLTVVRLSDQKDSYGVRLWECRCDACDGPPAYVLGAHLRNGARTSCGCRYVSKPKTLTTTRSKRMDLTGKRFGRLTVLEEAEQLGTKRRWLCRCDCGSPPITVKMDSLRSGNTQSCGCYKIDRTSEANTVDIVGKRFGKLTVVRMLPEKQNQIPYYECKCDCGEKKNVAGTNLRSGQVKSCGCGRKSGKNKKRLDLTGNRYGRLTVLSEVEPHGTMRRWLCKCDCGKLVPFIVTMTNLRSGRTQSCGCLRREKSSKSGGRRRRKMNNWTGSGEWEGWKIIEGRLVSPSGRAYKPEDIEPDKYTQAELARVLGITRGAIQDRIKRGTLPPFDGEVNGRGYWSSETIAGIIAK